MARTHSRKAMPDPQRQALVRAQAARGEYEFVIVGSGASGATVARQLASGGHKVLVVEAGRPVRKVGTFPRAISFFDVERLSRMPPRSVGGVRIWRAFATGGTTVFSCANGVPSLTCELEAAGAGIEDELRDVEKELCVSPMAEGLLSQGTRSILEASRELGFRMEMTPKFIRFDKCRRCGHCVYGCAYGAKWSALDPLDDALRHGADLLVDTRVSSVRVKRDKAVGVEAISARKRIFIRAPRVVLCAGGLGTPQVLHRSGVQGAGQGLFVDIFVTAYGLTDGLDMTREPPMAIADMEFQRGRGFILASYVNTGMPLRFVDGGVRAALLPRQRMIGLMVKIADERSGHIGAGNRVRKAITEQDRRRLDEGLGIARDILLKAGVTPRSLRVSHPQAAHPGGTAAIGEVVDADLRTGVEGLFVCDASVLPTAPGLPPILTLLALAKRLATRLAQE